MTLQFRKATAQKIGQATMEKQLARIRLAEIVCLALYQITVELEVQFLPPGFWKRPEDTTPIYPTNTRRSPRQVTDETRERFLRELNPTAVCTQKNLLRGYHAYRYDDDKVILENSKTGNALYLIRTPNWVTLATETKWKLLTTRPAGFIGRLIHGQTDKWQQCLKNFVQNRNFEVTYRKGNTTIATATITDIK